MTLLEPFTPRQAEIASLICDGQCNKKIARLLGISPRTVEDHRSEIYRKADVHNAVEFVTKMLKEPA